LWSRLDRHLGRGYSAVWAERLVISELDDRTVSQALAAGVPCQRIWRAAWTVLELPDTER